jgi:hypothetical protein
MEEATRSRQPVSPQPHRHHSQQTALFHVPLSATCAARSAKNIADWNSYLPTACVREMVRMGWDYTT